MIPSIQPTRSGGRVVIGDTPWGRFCVEWDGDGKLVAHEIKIRTPGDHAAVKAEPGGCRGCQQGKSDSPSDKRNDLAAWHQAVREGTTGP